MIELVQFLASTFTAIEVSQLPSELVSRIASVLDENYALRKQVNKLQIPEKGLTPCRQFMGSLSVRKSAVQWPR